MAWPVAGAEYRLPELVEPERFGPRYFEFSLVAWEFGSLALQRRKPAVHGLKAPSLSSSSPRLPRIPRRCRRPVDPQNQVRRLSRPGPPRRLSDQGIHTATRLDPPFQEDRRRRLAHRRGQRRYRRRIRRAGRRRHHGLFRPAERIERQFGQLCWSPSTCCTSTGVTCGSCRCKSDRSLKKVVADRRPLQRELRDRRTGHVRARLQGRL